MKKTHFVPQKLARVTFVASMLLMGGASVQAAPGSDFDNDGDDDVLLRHVVNNNYQRYTVQSGQVTGWVGLGVPATYIAANWVHQANIDTDGDGDKDILITNTTDGKWRVLIMENGLYQSNSPLWMNSSLSYSFAGAGDLDGDGDDDVILRNTSTGTYQKNLIQATAVALKANLPLWGGAYTLEVLGDFDGDLDDDVLMRNSSTGGYVRFDMQGGNIADSGGLFPIYKSSDYILQVAGDLDADGDDDLLVRSTSTGSWVSFIMQNNLVQSTLSQGNLYKSSDWAFQAFGDYDNDGDDDILLRDIVTTADWRRFNVQTGSVTGNIVFGLFSSFNVTIQD
ncbi:MAG: VCBS repeat-containing protein [Pseudomonadales bacterium]|nr:VCBS repeat-containing protein [Pseudomonadales bacterium]